MGCRKDMDLEDLYHVNFKECYTPRILHNVKVTGFDEELMNKAETLSSKLQDLFKFTSPDEDLQNVSRIIKTSGLKVDQVNSLSQPRALQQELVMEKNNLIFLDQKYFKFGFDDDSKVNGHINTAIETANAIDSSMFSTVFDESESINFLEIDNTKAPLPTKNGQEKRKKRYKKKRNEELGSTPNTDIPTDSVGAPPGVTASNVRNVRYELNLTKNSNNSLQFRL